MLTDAASIAQIALVLITAVGIIVTLRIAVATIREIRNDRALRHRPYLAFDQGGFKYRVEFVAAGKSIPGVNPSYVAKVFPDLPANALSVRLVERSDKDFGVGRLTNYGVGPALHTKVIWIAQHISIGTEKFDIDAKKLSEPVYCRDLNSMPSYKAHISPNATTFLTRLPTFIEKDIEKKITEVHGYLAITCMDIFHSHLTTMQEFRIFTDYKDNVPTVHITFGALIPENRKERP
jgi:hypothetical protein